LRGRFGDGWDGVGERIGERMLAREVKAGRQKERGVEFRD
jgi:hypothetical protein